MIEINKEALINYSLIILAVISPVLAGELDDKWNRKNLVYQRVKADNKPF